MNLLLSFRRSFRQNISRETTTILSLCTSFIIPMTIGLFAPLLAPNMLSELVKIRKVIIIFIGRISRVVIGLIAFKQKSEMRFYSYFGILASSRCVRSPSRHDRPPEARESSAATGTGLAGFSAGAQLAISSCMLRLAGEVGIFMWVGQHV